VPVLPGRSTFTKQVTAAGFQLKGSGWYATDFKGGNSPPPRSGDESSQCGRRPTQPQPTEDLRQPRRTLTRTPAAG
jgi:hypothetical protein